MDLLGKKLNWTCPCKKPESLEWAFLPAKLSEIMDDRKQRGKEGWGIVCGVLLKLLLVAFSSAAMWAAENQNALHPLAASASPILVLTVCLYSSIGSSCYLRVPRNYGLWRSPITISVVSSRSRHLHTRQQTKSGKNGAPWHAWGRNAKNDIGLMQLACTGPMSLAPLRELQPAPLLQP